MRRRSFVVMLDIDGVLADFTLAFRTLCQGDDPTVVIHGTREQKTWEYDDIAPETLACAWAHVHHSEDFWTRLPVLTTRREVAMIAALPARHDVYFVTDRRGVAVKAQTEQWLRSRGFSTEPTVIITEVKSHVAAAIVPDYAIDDILYNVTTISLAALTRAYLLNQPYNAEVPWGPWDYRVHTVEAFLHDVEAGA